MSDELIPKETQALADLSADIGALLEAARRKAARSINAIMTATYWEIGRRIVEYEQEGAEHAGYGEQALARLSSDLTARFGRGFSERNLRQMRQFYLTWQIRQTVSGESKPTLQAKRKAKIAQTLSAESPALPAPDAQDYLNALAAVFPLSWSHYVRLLSLQDEYARRFYETEALRGGWSLRQLERQINSMFYERTALSKNKAAMLTKHAAAKPEDTMTAEEEIKSPYVLEFLGLKDEYSEAELEEALAFLTYRTPGIEETDTTGMFSDHPEQKPIPLAKRRARTA